jgi:hypothetical protein
MTTVKEQESLAAVISAKVERTYGTMREYIHAVMAECLSRGIEVGYRKVSRIYLRWQKENADRVDIAMGVTEGRHGRDRTMGNDPTGETAVRNIMRELIA